MFTSSTLKDLLLILSLMIQIACVTQAEQPMVEPIIANDNLNAVQTLNNNGENKLEQTTVNKDTKPPIAIKKVTMRGGKPPLRLYYFDIEIQSQRNEYQWLLFRKLGSTPLSESGVFNNFDWMKKPLQIEPHAFDSDVDKVFVVRFYGEQSFNAIQLPRQGTIKLEQFQINSFSDVSEFEAWEVQSLLVNGEVPMEDWFSDVFNQTEHSGNNSQNLNEISKSKEKVGQMKPDSSKEVESVTAQGVRKWNISFKLSAK